MPSDAQPHRPPFSCSRPVRARRGGSGAYVTTAVLIVLSLMNSVGASFLSRPVPNAAASTPNLYVGHAARLTAKIPPDGLSNSPESSTMPDQTAW